MKAFDNKYAFSYLKQLLTLFFLVALVSITLIQASQFVSAASHNPNATKEKRIETKFWFDVREGRENVMKFNESAERGVGFKSINFSCSENVGILRLTVSRVGPAFISRETEDLIDEKVYRYLKITHSGMDACSPQSFNSSFSVSKGWLEKRGLIFDSASLHRYSLGWKEANSSFVESTESRFKFQAESDFLKSTYWAIAMNATEEEEKTVDACGDGICGINETWRTCRLDCERPTDATETVCWSCWGVVSFIGLLFLVVFYLIRRRKEE